MAAAEPATRHEVSFPSGEDTCAAWLYMPAGVTAPPVVILGHGLGGTREMRLDAFAERFAQAGIAALAFTYRHFGDSSGQPRQLLSIKRQLADWEAAIAYVKARHDLDGTRIAVWGSSFQGVTHYCKGFRFDSRAPHTHDDSPRRAPRFDRPDERLGRSSGLRGATAA